MNELAATPLPGGGVLSDRIYFLHVYTVEAHPMAPAPSPYAGRIWEMNYSTIGQQYTYADRVAAARKVRPEILGRQIQLVDALEPGVEVNPVWCTYGPTPNAGFLIRQDGIIEVAQEWLYIDQLKAAAMKLVSGEP